MSESCLRSEILKWEAVAKAFGALAGIERFSEHPKYWHYF
jgi:hypothetical protein